LKKIWWIITVIIFGGFILTIGLVEILGDKEEDIFPSDIKQLIYNLEEGIYEKKYSASINSENVYIKSEKKSYTYTLPDDLFYISFAPYMTYTHECFTHSLTGCQGELSNKDMYVKVYDSNDNIIIDEMMNTGDDGFIGLFLEKDMDYRVDVEYDGYGSSFVTDPLQTCYTEVKLR
jgi:hypothetical protein